MNRIALCLSIAALMMSVAAFWMAARRDDATLVFVPRTTTPLPFQMLPNATLTGCAQILPPDPQRCAD